MCIFISNIHKNYRTQAIYDVYKKTMAGKYQNCKEVVSAIKKAVAIDMNWIGRGAEKQSDKRVTFKGEKEGEERTYATRRACSASNPSRGQGGETCENYEQRGEPRGRKEAIDDIVRAMRELELRMDKEKAESTKVRLADEEAIARKDDANTRRLGEKIDKMSDTMDKHMGEMLKTLKDVAEGMRVLTGQPGLTKPAYQPPTTDRSRRPSQSDRPPYSPRRTGSRENTPPRACWECGVVGHFRDNCPERSAQGSLNSKGAAVTDGQ